MPPGPYFGTFLVTAIGLNVEKEGGKMPVVIADRLQLVNYNKDVVSVELLQIE